MVQTRLFPRRSEMFERGRNPEVFAYRNSGGTFFREKYQKSGITIFQQFSSVPKNYAGATLESYTWPVVQ